MNFERRREPVAASRASASPQEQSENREASFDMDAAQAMITRVREAADFSATETGKMQGRAMEYAARLSLGEEMGDAARGREKLEAFTQSLSA